MHILFIVIKVAIVCCTDVSVHRGNTQKSLLRRSDWAIDY